MADSWRLVDTGLRSAAQNIALDRAILEARRSEEVPSTLRFMRFPPCALIGCGQSVEQEVNANYCTSAGIDVQRRLSGGDVMCLDPGQLMWGLYLHRRDVGAADLRAISRRLCHAAAAAVGALGLDARLRGRSEIEVDGRRVSDAAGVFDGDGLLFQGTLLIDLDPASALRASRLCGAAAPRAGERIASLRDLLKAAPDRGLIKRYLAEAFESEFGVEFREGDLTLSEEARFRAALREIDHPDWIDLVKRSAAALPVIEASHPAAGGRLFATAAFDREARLLRQVWFSADFPVVPPRTLPDLEAELRYTLFERLEARVGAFFGARAVTSPSPTAADFVNVVRLAVRQPLVDRV